MSVIPGEYMDYRIRLSFFFQSIASGMTLENGATAARIVVVDGNDDHEQSNKRQHSEENNAMDVQPRPELVIHMPVQVSLCINEIFSQYHRLKLFPNLM